MTIKFFWRGEGETLAAGVDYSAGDTTATAANSASISSSAALHSQTNGILTAATATSRYGFDPTSIVNKAVGSVGFSFRFPSALPPAANSYGVRIENAAASDHMGTEISSTYARLRVTKNGVGSIYATASYSLATNTTYAVVFRWDFANDKIACELYSSAGALLASDEQIDAGFSAYEIDALTTYGLRVGNSTGAGTIVMHLVKVFVSDDYDEPIQNNLDISDIDDYVAGSATKYLKLLTHADAQSKTGVAGVVFAAPSGSDLTGAKIGEFTAQAFEATLEGGEAVLLVDVADFGGSALTTSDAPRVEVRYDDAGTIKGTAIVPATVIEV